MALKPRACVTRSAKQSMSDPTKWANVLHIKKKRQEQTMFKTISLNVWWQPLQIFIWDQRASIFATFFVF